MIGELLAGALIGPHALGVVGHPDAALLSMFRDEATAEAVVDVVFRVLASLGLIILLFHVGLETRVVDLVHVGGRALRVAGLEVALTFSLGFLATRFLLQESVSGALFVAAAMVATSVGITARVLSDLGRLNRTEARVILGAALADDVIGLLVFAVVSAAARTGGVSLLEVGAIALQAIAFIGLIAWGGTHLTKRFSLHLERLHIQNAPFVVAIGVCLGLAALSSRIGLASIVGAFLAGIIFAEAREHFQLQRASMAVYELLVPFFFVITGSQVNWRLFLDPSTLALASLLLLVAVAGKVVGSGLGALGMEWRRVAIVGVGMIPRGEVSLVVAGSAASLGAISGRIFSVMVIMVVVTTLIAPPILSALYSQRTRPVETPSTSGSL